MRRARAKFALRRSLGQPPSLFPSSAFWSGATRAIGCCFFLATLAGVDGYAQDSHRNAGSQYFDEADHLLTENWNSDVTGLAEKGWLAVREAGPKDPGFLDGVYTAARIFRNLGRDLRVESTYAEAMAACEASALLPVKARLSFMLAHDLIGQREFVKAERELRSALLEEAHAAHKSVLYVAFLQALAFVREQEGDLIEAESLYKTALSYATPDLSGVVVDSFVRSPGPLYPPIGEPRTTLAGFYLQHDRVKQAEFLYRKAAAQPGPDPAERLSALRLLASFLSFYGSKEEALTFEKQVAALLEKQQTDNLRFSHQAEYELNTLAQREAEAGHDVEARTILEQHLTQTGEEKGRTSLEYQSALLALLQNRLQDNDYETAEKLARETLRLAQDSGASSDSALSRSAVSALADVRRAQGHAEEADALAKEIDPPAPEYSGPSQHLAAAVEALVRDGHPQEALAKVQESAESSDPAHPNDSPDFRWLAQLFVTFGHKPEAAKVAALALPLQEMRAGSNSPGSLYALVDWAGFYRGQLEMLAQADALLSRAEKIVRDCCGVDSPRMEAVLLERAWLAMAAEGQAAGIHRLEKLRDFRTSIYGSNSRYVEDATYQLADWRAQFNDWPEAAKLYMDTLEISARRTGGHGFEYVSLLDRVATQFATHGDIQMASMLNQRAFELATGFPREDELKYTIESHRKEIQSRISATNQ